MAVAIPHRTQAQTGGPTVIIKDIPRKIADFVTKQKDAIKDKLKVAGDVAYKTGLRVFYQQLAQLTFNFVSTAGTGQKPLFMTDPYYFQNVLVGAQNDFLDTLATDYFGVQVAAGSTAQEKAIALLARGILNPATECEAQCSAAAKFDQGNIAALEGDAKSATEYARTWFEQYSAPGSQVPLEMDCPLLFEQSTNTYKHSLSQTSKLTPDICARELNNLLVTEKQKASRAIHQCVKQCAAGKQTTLRNDPELNRLVGNEQVALAVSELFRPQQNDLGTLLKVTSDARTKGIAVTAAERDIAANSGIQPVRTLSGEVKAPGSISQQYANIGIDKATGDVGVLTGSRIADIISQAAGDALIARIGKALLNNCGLNPKACKSPTGTTQQARLIFGTARGTAAGQIQTIQLGKADIVSGDPSRNPISTTEQLQSLGIIDQRFASAIDQKLTVGEALAGGYLDGDRIFGFASNREQPSDGYSYRTILYLRQARIIPVGWELAAKYFELYDKSNDGLGLTELVSKFSICGQDSQHDDNPSGAKTCAAVAGVPSATVGQACTSDGDCSNVTGACVKVPSASPYCGLVDPDWVLKAPLTYCRKQGAGEEIITKTFVCDEDTNGNNRVDCSPITSNPLGGDVGRYEYQRKTDTCVDEPTCVAENEDGSCKTYGYCFQDRRTFRLNGTMCPNYYASCTAYTDQFGSEVAYLSKTIDVNGCSTENAGCQAYCGDRRDTGGTFLCTANASSVACPAGETCTCRLAGGESCSVAGGARTCVTGSGATCTLGTNFTYFDRDVQSCDASGEGCRQFISTASPANLLANAGFEQHEAGSCPSGELFKGWGCQQPSTENSGIGDNNTTSVFIPNGGAGLTYTNDRVPPGLDTGRPLAKQTFTLSYYAKSDAGTCTGTYGLRATDPGVDLDPAGGVNNTVSATASYTTTWSRFNSTFFIPDGAYDNVQAKHVIQAFVNSSSCNILVDNIELTTADTTTPYADYGSTNLTYLNKSRQVCSRVDVGCDKFTPVGGGEAISGVVNWPDRCTAENAGCRAYRKEATVNFPIRPAVDPINLTATSGRTCSASEVGCEEYTNLDVAAQGGEAKEYYSRIQVCVKPAAGSPSQQTYFTWIGDDQNGYQLRSFRLKASNISNVGSEAGTGPCTNLKLATNTDDNNPACEDTSTNRGMCSAGDIGVNPDCSQYFDGAGNVFYRLRSRIIPVSDACHPYRNTIDNAADKIYNILGSQSASCSAAAAQCRAFTGNAGGTATPVFVDNFEGSSAVTNSWQGVAGGSVALSPESVNAGGRSMDANGSIATRPTVLAERLRSGSTYTLSFWAKPNGATRLTQAFIQVGSDVYYLAGSTRPDVALASEWHPYTVGPVTIDSNPSGQTVQLGLQFQNAGVSARAFVDNVSLTEVNDSLYLIDGTFRTCPDSELGCEAYTNRNNQSVYFKSVTRLCAAEVIGCTAFIDTQNSTDPFASTPIRGVSVPGDTTIPLIDSQSSRCTADQKGCTAFGIPNLDVNKKIISYETAYLKDDPDAHVQILCSANELYCAEFTGSDGSKSFFKDPGSQTCEFKKLGGDTEFRWYMTGTSHRCPISTPPAEGVPTGRACTKACTGGLRDGLSCVQDADCPASNGSCVNSFCQGGAKNGLSCTDSRDCTSSAGTCSGDQSNVGKSCTLATASADCSGGNICELWVGVCPVEQNGCNEYRDPSDPAQCRSTCPLQLSATSGKPIPFDEACQPTTCVSGAKTGAYCATNSDCPGRCLGGTTPDRFCRADTDCGGTGTCSNVGTCSAEGIPGCRAYTYLRQTIEPNAAECNGRVDIANGCRPFNDTSNPTLNFRSF